MDVPQLSPQLIDALRTWFHPKDRSVYLAPSTFAYLPGGIGYLSMAFISETVLSASATSVTFSNIPQDFRHLLLTYQVRSDTATEIDGIILRFNGDSGANYDNQILRGIGGTPFHAIGRGVSVQEIGSCEASNSRNNLFSNSFALIQLYSRTGIDKEALGFTQIYGNSSADIDFLISMNGIHWYNTNVITSINLLPSTGPNFVSGSRFQLYGVL